MTPPPLASEARQPPPPPPLRGGGFHIPSNLDPKLQADYSRWPQDRLSDLGTKLASLKYLLPFDVHSADLVERLFNDLVRLVETNKNIVVE